MSPDRPTVSPVIPEQSDFAVGGKDLASTGVSPDPASSQAS